jgi:hypothetical protein
MKLRFIGTDGSMGLRKGRIYNVTIYDKLNHIVVAWSNGLCPYNSPQTLAKNWEAIR